MGANEDIAEREPSLASLARDVKFASLARGAKFVRDVNQVERDAKEAERAERSFAEDVVE